ncbi:MAG: hypothetical protein A2W03_13355 [Candidatus Aminicenantes bacterium RBG_16_63_16]|nr:MAG: hypothetical protein A2W03_13355 [Candidatus Aminicenantes bacterium RBG_16_63_16]
MGVKAIFKIPWCRRAIGRTVLYLASLFFLVFRLFPISVFDGQISAHKLSLSEKIQKADLIFIGRGSEGFTAPVEKMALIDLSKKKDGFGQGGEK